MITVLRARIASTPTTGISQKIVTSLNVAGLQKIVTTHFVLVQRKIVWISILPKNVSGSTNASIVLNRIDVAIVSRFITVQIVFLSTTVLGVKIVSFAQIL